MKKEQGRLANTDKIFQHNDKLKTVLSAFQKSINGIEVSKKELKAGGRHTLKAIEGSSLTSNKIHSYARQSSMRVVCNKLLAEAKLQTGKDIPKLSDINVKTLESALKKRVDSLQLRSLKSELSLWGRIADQIKVRDSNGNVKPAFKDGVKVIKTQRSRAVAKPQPMKNQTYKGFNDSREVIKNLKEPAHKAIATIQMHSGARINDARNAIQLMTFKDGEVQFKESKGGKDYDVRHLTKDEVLEMKEAYKVLKNFKPKRKDSNSKVVPYTTYRSALIKASEKAGEIRNNTHAFRHDKTRRFTIEARKYHTDKEADQMASDMLGHGRLTVREEFYKI